MPLSDLWLLKHLPRPQARARLFCFPHAGVGASTYRLWPKGLPEELEVCALQTPGRENRLREPALSSLPKLVEALVPVLLPHLELPFAFFGHSMGAVLASEVARALVAAGAPSPSHLVVSGRRPPHVKGPETLMHPLPDAQFVAEISRRYGGIPPAVLQERELMALLLPGLRADITALETHQPPPRPPLACSITAFGGDEDRLTPLEHLDAWRGETRGAFRVRTFAGGHFYLDARRAEVLADLSVTLAPLLRARAGEVTA